STDAIDLDVDIELGGLSGLVLHADGHGVAGCEVALVGRYANPDGEWVHAKAYGITDREGAFAFERLPAGTYDARVWDRRAGRGRVEGIRVQAGQQTGS